MYSATNLSPQRHSANKSSDQCTEGADMIRHPHSQGGRHPERRMNPAEIVMPEVGR